MPILRSALVAAVMLLGGACVNRQPWVKPYERDHLSDPIMSWDRDPISRAYWDHVRETREESRGATGGTPGGCGCN